MSYIPLPVRVAVGLVATAVEQACKLPEQLADLPVTAASRAVQAGMRVQQRVTALAIKGDEVFSRLRPVADTPSWARFDEDDELPEYSRDTIGNTTGGATSKTQQNGGPVPAPELGEVDEADVARAMTPAPTGADGTKPGDASGPQPPLAGYEEMSLAQLRGRLRGLSLRQLVELLAYERTHQDRPPFVTLLSNRISTVRSR
jgi:hypothetical protein